MAYFPHISSGALWSGLVPNFYLEIEWLGESLVIHVVILDVEAARGLLS